MRKGGSVCNTVVSVYLGTWYRVPGPDCTTWWCSGGTVAVLGIGTVAVAEHQERERREGGAGANKTLRL